ncbi:hypothetical protein HRbin30_00091 [bacterium HR30]|nr:hypothetical protein HRbin30_00091 [bacterium HR30]
MSRKEIQDFTIPPLPEQQEIAHILLQAADRKIEAEEL